MLELTPSWGAQPVHPAHIGCPFSHVRSLCWWSAFSPALAPLFLFGSSSGKVLPNDLTPFTEGYRPPKHGYFQQSGECDQLLRMWTDQCAFKEETENVYHAGPKMVSDERDTTATGGAGRGRQKHLLGGSVGTKTARANRLC